MALEGTLHDMSLGDLFQIFRMGAKNGVLVLREKRERGVIYVAGGRLIDAALLCAQGTVRAAQEEAVIQMLLWDNGSFVFRHDLAVLERPKRIVHDGEWLVLESMRRRDDPTRALPYVSITLETRLQLSPLPSSAESGVSLDMNQWRILSQVSSSPNLRTICEATGIAPEQAIRTLSELMSIGLVEVVPTISAPKPKPPVRREGQQAAPSQATMNPTSTGAAVSTVEAPAERPQVGRGLLDAIMRRVRGL